MQASALPKPARGFGECRIAALRFRARRSSRSAASGTCQAQAHTAHLVGESPPEPYAATIMAWLTRLDDRRRLTPHEHAPVPPGGFATSSRTTPAMVMKELDQPRLEARTRISPPAPPGSARPDGSNRPARQAAPMRRSGRRQALEGLRARPARSSVRRSSAAALRAPARHARPALGADRLPEDGHSHSMRSIRPRPTSTALALARCQRRKRDGAPRACELASCSNRLSSRRCQANDRRGW